MLCFLYWFNAFWVVENIAFNKTTWQQNSDPRFNWGADRVVDGKYSDLSADGGQCTLTTFGKNNTEWRVDLREVSSIYCIFIQYRTDNLPWGNIIFYSMIIAHWFAVVQKADCIFNMLTKSWFKQNATLAFLTFILCIFTKVF